MAKLHLSLKANYLHYSQNKNYNNITILQLKRTLWFSKHSNICYVINTQFINKIIELELKSYLLKYFGRQRGKCNYMAFVE